MSRRTRALLVAVLLALATAGLGVLLGAPPAQALPGIPDCKNPPEPIPAGSGVSGMVDPAVAPPAGAGAGAGAGGYAQYGYAGLRWSTYDLGCIGSVTDTGTDVDTLIGNWGLGSAIFVVSVGNGLHQRVVDPSWLVPLDDVTASVTATVHDAIWAPWGAVALLGVVSLLLLQSVRGQLSDVIRGAAWALLVLTVLAGVVNYPLRAGQLYDAAVIGTLGDLESATLGPGGAGANSAQAHGALLVDRVLYQSWLRGELGSPQGPAAKRWGAQLFAAQALSYAEVASAGDDPAKQAALVTAKNDAWTTLAQQIQDTDPGTYAQLQGRSGGRAAAGAMALFAASTTSLFRVVADLFLAAGLVMLRILVMFFPAVATLGVMLVFAGLVRRLGNAAGAAVINVVAFGAASVLHTTIVTAALSRSDSLSWMAVVLCLLVTVILFVLCLPLLSLTALGGAPGGGWARGALRGAGRVAGGYLAARRGTRDGQPEPDAAPVTAGPTVIVVGGGHSRRDEQAPAQEAQPDDEPAPRVWVARARPAGSAGPAGSAAAAGELGGSGDRALSDPARPAPRELPGSPRIALPGGSPAPAPAIGPVPNPSPAPAAAYRQPEPRLAEFPVPQALSWPDPSGLAARDDTPVLEGRVLDREAQLDWHDGNLAQDAPVPPGSSAGAALLVWDPRDAVARSEPLAAATGGDPS